MVSRPRWRVLRALARRDLARVQGSRPGPRWRGRLVGIALLGAAALVPGPGAPTSAGPAAPAVQAAPSVALPPGVGAAPPGTGPVLETTADGTPLLRARRVAPGLRRALDAASARAGRPVLVRAQTAPPPALPPQPRALLILLIAASLLTGPLTESLPGERSQKTWETLRAAAVTPAELLGGKWLAWTGPAVAGSGLALAAAVLRGHLLLGPGLLGLPLALGLVVALGLWLLAPSHDPAGGATVPVRVVPLVVVGAALGAWALAPGAAAAWVPLGAPLLWAMGGTAPGLALGATLTTLVAVPLLLAHAARRAVRPLRHRPPLPVVPALFATAAHLALAGGGAGRLGGDPVLAQLAAALVVAATAAVLHHRAPAAAAPPSRPAGGVVPALALAAVVALAPAGPALVAVPPPPLALALVAALAQEWLYRGILTRDSPPAGAALWGLLWAVGCGLGAPLQAALLAVGLGLLARRWGLGAAVLARLVVVVVTAA